MANEAFIEKPIKCEDLTRLSSASHLSRSNYSTYVPQGVEGKETGVQVGLQVVKIPCVY